MYTYRSSKYVPLKHGPYVILRCKYWETLSRTQTYSHYQIPYYWTTTSHLRIALQRAEHSHAERTFIRPSNTDLGNVTNINYNYFSVQHTCSLMWQCSTTCFGTLSHRQVIYQLLSLIYKKHSSYNITLVSLFSFPSCVLKTPLSIITICFRTCHSRDTHSVNSFGCNFYYRIQFTFIS
jgi:hypothetical protein